MRLSSASDVSWLYITAVSLSVLWGGSVGSTEPDVPDSALPLTVRADEPLDATLIELPTTETPKELDLTPDQQRRAVFNALLESRRSPASPRKPQAMREDAPVHVGSPERVALLPPATDDSSGKKSRRNQQPAAPEKSLADYPFASVNRHLGRLEDLPSAEYQRPGDGCQLTAQQAACDAAAHAALANALEKERSVARSPLCRRNQRGHCDGSLRSKLLALRALHERNEAAHNALKLFYGIAEIDAQLPILERSLANLERSIDNVNAMEREQVDVPFDGSRLARQYFSLLDKREDLQMKRLQAQEQLRVLVGADQCPDGPIQAYADLSVNVMHLSSETEVADGLTKRADTLALDYLCNCLSIESLPSVRTALAGSDSLLGDGGGPAAFCRLALLFRRAKQVASPGELEARRQQIATLRQESRRQATAEIRAAVVEVQARQRQVALGQSQVESWLQRVNDLEKLFEIDEATRFEIDAAELELLNAISQLLRKSMQWRLAEVQLVAAKGALAYECGYRAPGPNCCDVCQ